MENFSFFLDGGHVSYAVAFSDLVNLTLYANCRNTGTLVEDLAGTNFVLFQTKIESYIN